MFKNSKKFLTVISYLNCGSAGVLIGVVFLDVLPTTGKVLNSKVKGYPLSYTLTVAVIFCMMVFLKLGHTHEHNEDECGSQ